ncbi:MAG: FkbO/Hyg5 family chorismatase [Umezawaea sp.]
MKSDQLTGHLPSSVFMGLKEIPENLTKDQILGVVKYTTECADPTAESGYPELSIHMVNSPNDGFAEVWTTDQPVESGEHNGIAYSHDGTYLLCTARIAPSTNYTAQTRTAYTDALDLMASLDYRKCFRMWNFVSDINGYNSRGLEIYRDFCQGRAEAFEQFDLDECKLPAATGIGSLGGGIAFYLLASKTDLTTPIENPNQMAAYRYPKRYGPKSPKFARATHITSGDPNRPRGQIYVAGTASIRGHETLHRGDVESQCHLALENIAHVIGSENLSTYGIEPGRELSELRNIKVYVRHDEDVETVRKICADAFATDVEIAFMNVDICRSDLLVEIEGIVP